MTISHHTYQLSCHSSMMPICHQTPPLASPTMPISHHVNQPPPSGSQKSCPSAIIPKSYYANQPLPPPFSQYANKPSSAYKNYAYQPSCNPSMMPICHNPPPRLIEPIDHWAYQPSSQLTLALLSRLLSLSACFAIKHWTLVTHKNSHIIYMTNIRLFNNTVLSIAYNKT